MSTLHGVSEPDLPDMPQACQNMPYLSLHRLSLEEPVKRPAPADTRKPGVRDIYGMEVENSMASTKALIETSQN